MTEALLKHGYKKTPFSLALSRSVYLYQYSGMYSVKEGSKINAVIFCISSQEFIFIVLKEQGVSAFERGIR